MKVSVACVSCPVTDVNGGYVCEAAPVSCEIEHEDDEVRQRPISSGKSRVIQEILSCGQISSMWLYSPVLLEIMECAACVWCRGRVRLFIVIAKDVARAARHFG
jgi:hypothetical protein